MTRDEDNGFKEWGGYFEAKKSKLEEQFAAASNPFHKTDLFKGISIFVNGRTDPSADELKRIMMVHGGTFHHYERSHTTYTIASTLPDVKVRNMNLSKFISAKWVVDCLAQKKILDYKPYLLFTNQKTSQPRINFATLKSPTRIETKTEATANKSKTKIERPADEQIELGGILKELQQAVVKSPEKQAQISSLSETINTNVSSTSYNANSSSNHARTAADPRFLTEFYKNSRLHHIATLGASFKQYICHLRQENAGKDFPKREELKYFKRATEIRGTRYVMHIDMDCFFVSVGLRSHPELRGLPVAVTHSKGGSAATDVPVHPQADRQAEQELFAQRFEHRLHDNTKADKVRSGFENKMSLSEIASCSYEAREKGIRNGMFVGHALKLCPELKTIPYDFEGYKDVASTLYNTVAQYTLNIEAVSCDEMFVELSDLVDDLRVDVMAFVTHLRNEVRTKTGCPCSAGVGPNKLLARLATKEAKPNGQYLLSTNRDILGYLAPMNLETLPGVGSSLSHKLKLAGFSNCGDVQQTTLMRLEMVMGKKLAQNLYNHCHGIDPRPLAYEQSRKTVSAEMNFGIRFTNATECQQFLRQLSDEVTKRLIEIKRKAKCINLKIMVRAADAPVETSKYMGHGVCDTISKSTNLKHCTDDVNVITGIVLSLMKQADLPVHELRGLGIHLTKLEDATEMRKENVIKQMFAKISDKPTRYPIKYSKKLEVEGERKPQIERDVGKPMNVINMLKASPEVQKSQQEPQIDAAIDPDVLAQLPEDIRREVLSNQCQYLLMEKYNEPSAKNPRKRSFSPAESLPKSNNNSPLNDSDFEPSTSRAGLARLQQRAAARQARQNNCRSDEIVADYIKELPKYTHPTILQYINKSPDETPKADGQTLKPDNGQCMNMLPKDDFEGLLISDYLNVLNNWVSQEEEPNPNDVDQLHTHICNLLRTDNMSRLYDVMRHFCRLINAKRSSSCRWHMAYKQIEINIQDIIMSLHGYNFHLTEGIRCDKCQEDFSLY